MLAQIGIKVKVNAMPRANYFPKIQNLDTSFYMLGWGGAVTDAQTTLSPVLRSLDKATGQGGFNYGRYSNPKLDALIDAAATEMTIDKRKELIRRAMRANINVVHRADNWLMGEWVQVGD
jgi:peptide/nickel transport system substrate-binding protein